MKRIKITGERQRDHALQCVREAAIGQCVTIADETRSNAQNAKMQAMLADVSKAKPMGRELTPEHWKGVFMDAIGKKPVWVPSLDGDSVLCLGYKSSHLRVAEMADLIEQIYSFGAENGVKWSEKYEES